MRSIGCLLPRRGAFCESEYRARGKAYAPSQRLQRALSTAVLQASIAWKTVSAFSAQTEQNIWKPCIVKLWGVAVATAQPRNLLPTAPF